MLLKNEKKIEILLNSNNYIKNYKKTRLDTEKTN